MKSQPRRWSVQILSAIYGTGGKNADVTAKLKDHLETYRRAFWSNPHWNKSLHIVYVKDGVRREQRHNENEHVLPESSYETEFWVDYSSASLAETVDVFHLKK